MTTSGVNTTAATADCELPSSELRSSCRSPKSPTAAALKASRPTSPEPSVRAPGSRRATASTNASAGISHVAVIAATPEGGFRLGNPDAKVKLLEFASLTCPHCGDFHAAAFETIKTKYVASGNVSYEFRNFVLQALADANKRHAVKRVIDCFIEEAGRRYTPVKAAD